MCERAPSFFTFRCSERKHTAITAQALNLDAHTVTHHHVLPWLVPIWSHGRWRFLRRNRWPKLWWGCCRWCWSWWIRDGLFLCFPFLFLGLLFFFFLNCFMYPLNWGENWVFYFFGFVCRVWWLEQLTKVTDTSAAQARKGKDIQGIPWERLNITRDSYRLTRLEQYRNFENILTSGEAVDKVFFVFFFSFPFSSFSL